MRMRAELIKCLISNAGNTSSATRRMRNGRSWRAAAAAEDTRVQCAVHVEYNNTTLSNVPAEGEAEVEVEVTND